MKKLVPFLAVLLVFCAADAFALSCRGKFINIGMLEFEVSDRCGEPVHVETWQENEYINPYGPGYVGVYPPPVAPFGIVVNYEEWVYNFGPNHFMAILTFRNGRLVKMENGSYGY